MAQRHKLLAWPKRSSSEARNIVLQVIGSHSGPISIRDLFEKVVKVPASPGANGEPLTPWARYLRNSKPAPPHPEHPIRSMRYLKRTVLEDLVRTRNVNKVHIKRVLSPVEVEQRRATMSKAQLKKASSSVAALSQPVSTWMWQLVGKKRPEKDVGGKEEEGAAAFGAEVGVGEDWGHLNRRRRGTRGEKVQRDVKWMRKVQRVRSADGFEDESSAA